LIDTYITRKLHFKGIFIEFIEILFHNPNGPQKPSFKTAGGEDGLISGRSFFPSRVWVKGAAEEFCRDHSFLF